MKTLKIKILEDKTDTGGHGVEGYKIEITSLIYSIDAFINMRNVVTTGSGVAIHHLFEKCPYISKGECINSINTAVQKAFNTWNPETTELTVEIAQ